MIIPPCTHAHIPYNSTWRWEYSAYASQSVHITWAFCPGNRKIWSLITWITWIDIQWYTIRMLRRHTHHNWRLWRRRMPLRSNPKPRRMPLRVPRSRYKESSSAWQNSDTTLPDMSGMLQCMCSNIHMGIRTCAGDYAPHHPSTSL